jgi:hypothetical protein
MVRSSRQELQFVAISIFPEASRWSPAPLETGAFPGFFIEGRGVRGEEEGVRSEEK